MLVVYFHAGFTGLGFLLFVGAWFVPLFDYVPPVRTRGTFSKTIAYFFETPISGKTCCIQICNQAKQFFYTQETFTNKAACTQEKPFKQTSSYTQETFQTRQFLHTASLSNKAVFKHNKPSNKAVFGFIRLSNKAAFTHQQALK